MSTLTASIALVPNNYYIGCTLATFISTPSYNLCMSFGKAKMGHYDDKPVAYYNYL
jgi:hypothetical protein